MGSIGLTEHSTALPARTEEHEPLTISQIRTTTPAAALDAELFLTA